MSYMLSYSALSTENYDDTLTGWILNPCIGDCNPTSTLEIVRNI